MWCSIGHQTRPLPGSADIVVHTEKISYKSNYQMWFFPFTEYLWWDPSHCITIFFHYTSVTSVMLDDKLKNQLGWISLSNNCCILSAGWLQWMHKVGEMYPLNSLFSMLSGASDRLILVPVCKQYQVTCNLQRRFKFRRWPLGVIA